MKTDTELRDELSSVFKDNPEVNKIVGYVMGMIVRERKSVPIEGMSVADFMKQRMEYSGAISVRKSAESLKSNIGMQVGFLLHSGKDVQETIDQIHEFAVGYAYQFRKDSDVKYNVEKEIMDQVFIIEHFIGNKTTLGIDALKQMSIDLSEIASKAGLCPVHYKKEIEWNILKEYITRFTTRASNGAFRDEILKQAKEWFDKLKPIESPASLIQGTKLWEYNLSGQAVAFAEWIEEHYRWSSINSCGKRKVLKYTRNTTSSDLQSPTSMNYSSNRRRHEKRRTCNNKWKSSILCLYVG